MHPNQYVPTLSITPLPLSLLAMQVSVFLVANCKRIRTMLFPGKGDFITCCFSGDSKWLVTAATEPESNIVVWNWEKEKAGVFFLLVLVF